ncbi:MAG: HIT family protein [Deltaproteobacteria bacterium]|nr:HIT family protein [Deltaproteobacteria bacterium]
MTLDGCVFCEIAAGRAEARVIHEDDLTMAILDVNPLARGHCLVIPRRHVPFWHDMSPEELAAVFEVAQCVAGKMMRALKPDFVCTFVRGKRIPHTHIFLVPSYGGDPLDRFFNALEGFQESPPSLVALRDPTTMDGVSEILRRA